MLKTLLSYDPIVERKLYQESSEMTDTTRLNMLKSYREELKMFVHSVNIDALLNEENQESASQRLDTIRAAYVLHKI